jgi:hypothetical protein
MMRPFTRHRRSPTALRDLIGDVRRATVVSAAILLAVVLAVVMAPRLAAQEVAGPRIEIQLPTEASSMVVRLRNAIDGAQFEELLRNGFDVRVHLRAELWKTGRIFNDVVAQTEWDVIVHFDQFDQTFEVARVGDRGEIAPLGTYRRLLDAKAALALPYTPPIGRPRPGQRHYYSVRADIETLDLRDLDEVTRWLRGELAPAVQGRKDPGTALGRGLRTLVARVMGGQARQLEARSPRFIVTEPAPPP